MKYLKRFIYVKLGLWWLDKPFIMYYTCNVGNAQNLLLSQWRFSMDT